MSIKMGVELKIRHIGIMEGRVFAYMDMFVGGKQLGGELSHDWNLSELAPDSELLLAVNKLRGIISDAVTELYLKDGTDA